jgi:hypothetical protein
MCSALSSLNGHNVEHLSSIATYVTLPAASTNSGDSLVNALAQTPAANANRGPPDVDRSRARASPRATLRSPHPPQRSGHHRHRRGAVRRRGLLATAQDTANRRHYSVQQRGRCERRDPDGRGKEIEPNRFFLVTGVRILL